MSPKLLACAITLSLIAMVAGASAPSTGFVPGQMWSIKSSVPTTAKIIIGRVEPWNGKVSVHVSLVDIPAPLGTPIGARPITIDHVPFSESAIAESVDQIVAVDVLPAPGFERGYQHWRADRNAGFFETSVPQVIRLMLEGIIRDRA